MYSEIKLPVRSIVKLPVRSIVALNKAIDRNRKNNPLRIIQRSNFEHTKNRIMYVKERNRKRTEKKLLETLSKETGFDLICSSCLQYKSKHHCQPVENILKTKAERYLVKFCYLLKNRSPGQYVCNLCLRDINKNKVPKRSRVNKLKYGSFPGSLIQDLKNNCVFIESSSALENSYAQQEYERSFFELNRLEAYLLKLVIPFIRVAHCPRGPYLKIKGDLILISADIDHTMSCVLPVNQNLIPVSFKRKLAYSGSYIDDFIEKKKIQIIFNWLRENNHLYKTIELDSSLISDFLQESLSTANEFGKNTRSSELTTSEETEVLCDTEDALENTQIREPAVSNQEHVLHNKTTIFMNKYSPDSDHASVVNKLASMINEFEIQNGVSFNANEDFDVDDEIINEDEFLNIAQESTEERQYFESRHDNDVVIEENFADIQDQLDLDPMEVDLVPLSDHQQQFKVDCFEDLDAIYNPTKQLVKCLKNESLQQAKHVSKKKKKVSVAPGEQGQFQNWGKDSYLEEKCFPDLFPYGTGGYLSSCLDDPEKAIGFAEYCVGQMMNCDPKFRKNHSYISFLLLVKESIHLKRCISTYFRQATRLPTLDKQNLAVINSENLSRFNRSYQVFQSLRGTAPYYEKSKLNLMALIRQFGCPTIFLTLSCAEFDWPELLKEIAETVYRRKISKEEIEQMSRKEKNKLISENVVQSTLHYSKRFQKLFTSMKSGFFKSENECYHVSFYYFRVEFQLRGAPHVHSLLWLKNKNGDDAPSFWTSQKETKLEIQSRYKN